MQYILVLDVPGIKEYVFGTERLVEIRGASALLDYLNREKTTEFLGEKLGQENVRCVFAGGGAGQYLIKASEEDLQAALSDLKGLFSRETKGGLRLISGYADLSDEKEYQKSLGNAFMRLNREKDENPFGEIPSFHSGLFRECESCSSPASDIVSYADTQKVLCRACKKKVVYAHENRGIWKDFSGFLSGRGLPSVGRPKDFEEIGRASAKDGYLAVVYADGNSMGKLVKSINSSETFSFFSETVDRSIREACHEALYDCCFSKGGKADILLLGGDDLLVCMSADAAIPFAIEAAKKFEEKTQGVFSKEPEKAPSVLRGQGMTISLGVVFAKSRTPFSLLLEQAEELLKSAKKGGAADPRSGDYYAPSFLDFHFFSRFNQVKVSDSRNKFLSLLHSEEKEPGAQGQADEEGAKKTYLILHQKPYSLENAEKLFHHASILSGNVPRSRLKRLGRAPFLGKINATLECLRLVGRTRDKKQKQAIWSALDAFGCGEIIPWRPEGEDAISTMLVDLIEVGEFARNISEEDANASDIA